MEANEKGDEEQSVADSTGNAKVKGSRKKKRNDDDNWYYCLCYPVRLELSKFSINVVLRASHIYLFFKAVSYLLYSGEESLNI